jgi:hypothetical protein
VSSYRNGFWICRGSWGKVAGVRTGAAGEVTTSPQPQPLFTFGKCGNRLAPVVAEGEERAPQAPTHSACHALCRWSGFRRHQLTSGPVEGGEEIRRARKSAENTNSGVLGGREREQSMMRLWEAPRGGCRSSTFIFETSPPPTSPSLRPSVLLLRVRYGKSKIVISWEKWIDIGLMLEVKGSQVACGIVLSVGNT